MGANRFLVGLNADTLFLCVIYLFILFIPSSYVYCFNIFPYLILFPAVVYGLIAFDFSYEV